MSPETSDRDEDLSELVGDLEATLAALRAELREEPERDRRQPPERRNRRERGSASGLPRPPSVSELLRFTEQYTLPTLISTLEATIRALELLRGTLRLVDPDRSALEASGGRGESAAAARLSSGAAGVGREAIAGVERALSELEAALAEADVPEDRASSELLGEARDLSAEVRERLDAARETADRGGRRRRSGVDRSTGAGSADRSDGVEIEVTGNGGDPGAPDRARDDRPEVDVEAELESIRHEVRGGEGADAADGSGETEADGDADGGSDADGGVAGDDAGSSA